MEISIRELGRHPRVAEFALRNGHDVTVTYYNQVIGVLTSAVENPHYRTASWRTAPNLLRIRMARKVMVSQIDPEFIRCAAPGPDVLLSAGVFYAVEHGAEHALAAIRAADSRSLLDVTELSLRECRGSDQRYRMALEYFEVNEQISVIELTQAITGRARMLMDLYGALGRQSVGLQIGEALLAATAMEHNLTLITPSPYRLLQLPTLKLGYLTEEGVVDLTERAEAHRAAGNRTVAPPWTKINGDYRMDFHRRYKPRSRPNGDLANGEMLHSAVSLSS